MKKIILIAIGVFVGATLGLVILSGCGKVVQGISNDNGSLSSITGNNSVNCYGGERTESSRTISGRVLSFLGLPIEGARVFADGISCVATTDADGNYLLENVPTGMVTVCAVSTRDSNPTHHNHFLVGVVTGQKNINFIIDRDEWYEALMEVMVVDANNNPVEGADVSVKGDTNGNTDDNYTDGNGLATITVLMARNEETMFVMAAKPGVGSYIGSGVHVISGETKVITVTLSSNEGIISGEVAPPSTPSNGISAVFPLIRTMTSRTTNPVAVFGVSPVTSDGLSYVATVPATSHYGMIGMYLSSEGYAYHAKADLGLSVGQTYNFEYVNPPVTFTFTTFEAGGNQYLNFNWTDPSSWTPDLYCLKLDASKSGSSYYRVIIYVFTSGSGVVIPKVWDFDADNPRAENLAIKLTSAIGQGEFNIEKLSFTEITGKSASLDAE